MKKLGAMAFGFKLAAVWLFGFAAAASAASDPLSRLSELPNAALYFATAQGVPLKEQKAEVPLVPASTIKLLTAYAALETWGADYRFHTDFLLDQEGQLTIRGFGDPMLVSEEIDDIVEQLKHKGVKRVRALRTDSGFFGTAVDISGRSTSDNPYDAAPGALACNFNTIFVRKTNAGLSSAEAQTPLTATARRLARDLPTGRHRINLGEAKNGALYCQELFEAKLRQAGIPVGETTEPAGSISKTVEYRHYNSRRLSEVVAAMLKYSNNFIANQLFLALGVANFQAPAAMEKSRQMMREFIAAHFRWSEFQLWEGSGLSRGNRFSARQLVDVLERFAPYASLLPEKVPGVLAKTGTLQGVSSYAGYIRRSDGLAPFALIVNHTVDPGFRSALAEALLSYPSPGNPE